MEDGVALFRYLRYVSMSTMRARRTNEEWSRHTRQTLLDRARQQFARHGYAATTTAALVRTTGATKGALYFHFADKQALFDAVTVDVAATVQAAVEAAAGRVGDPVEGLIEGCRAWLASASSDEARQILLIDAPSVLGWRRWREIDAAHSMGSLRAGIDACLSARPVRHVSPAALTHLVSGALNEAVLAIGEGAVPLDDVVQTTTALLRALLAPSRT
ncbi:MAG: TetR/AcrR family transcriptional regulator [Myxococcaceae bacterium]|nr:TetR/AcrR family transcriptional regulator [Myxococcaceae bacterium]